MDRKLTRARMSRIRSALLALALAPGLLASCIVDEGFSYSVLNDSDLAVVVDVREQLHRTFDIPAHSYAGIAGGMGRVDPGWTIALVDASCRPIQTLAMDPKSNLVYVDSGGEVRVVSGLAWAYGSRTAKSQQVTARTTPCAEPSASPS
jgi:hypothetical protein